MEFIVDEEDVERPIKVEPKIEPFPCQLSVRIAAIAIQPASAASTSSEEPYVPEYRTQPLCRIPSGQLGPAETPQGRGRPKGLKSRPRIESVHGLPVPPKRAAAARARDSMASSNRS